MSPGTVSVFGVRGRFLDATHVQQNHTRRGDASPPGRGLAWVNGSSGLGLLNLLSSWFDVVWDSVVPSLRPLFVPSTRVPLL
ncbi:hypothetical protein DPEC_G00241670 [Dallia pectoralis]|uniref:Uncharacterized protein n=1 Tax=Dallia pectoralis TaxID=75939 RepID=A0ACC2FUU1_DALPE|nr:hypothetical protein DPEC_G00241670 [Dallia pectoralis]